MLTWLDPDRLDHGDVAAAVALLEGARTVDRPFDLSPTASWFVAGVRHGWDGDPSVHALARDADGRVIAVLEVELPHWDNTHLGLIEVTVDPLVRGQGIGSRLFKVGVERVRADGRTLILAESYDNSAGVEFLKAMGLDRASEEVKRRLDLTTLEHAGLDDEYAAAAHRAGGYELVRISGPTPEGLLADVVAMTAVINDAPTDDLEIEDEVFSPERIRAFEKSQLAFGRRLYRLIARERGTGVFAGHTMVGVESERPWHASQYDTSVTRAHRGHRLGLFLKIGMLRWLRESEAQLRTIDTWNAASNAHMIHVNETVGYQVIASTTTWQRRL